MFKCLNLRAEILMKVVFNKNFTLRLVELTHYWQRTPMTRGGKSNIFD